MHLLVAEAHMYGTMVWQLGCDPKTDLTIYGLRGTSMFSARKSHVVR